MGLDGERDFHLAGLLYPRAKLIRHSVFGVVPSVGAPSGGGLYQRRPPRGTLVAHLGGGAKPVPG
jgi:hypothetical protein